MESTSIGQSRLSRSSLCSQAPGRIRSVTGMNRSSLPRSGINSALFQRECDPIDRQHIGRNPVVDLMGFRVTHNLLETMLNDVLQSLVHFFLAPEKSLAVLHPLEITHCHSAGVGQDVGNDEDAFAVNDLIRQRRAWTV